MAQALVPFAEIQQMAHAVAASGLFGIHTPEQAAALMLLAQAEGRHPAIAARDYHIIEGRPTLKADTMLARFQEAGGRVDWQTLSNTEASATFSHPSGGSISMSWTIQDAVLAGLANRANWKRYPRAMLRARLISEAIRTVFPAVLCGAYTPEEVEDIAADPPEERHMGPAEVVRDEGAEARPSPSPVQAEANSPAAPATNDENAAAESADDPSVDEAFRIRMETFVARVAAKGSWETGLATLAERGLTPAQLAYGRRRLEAVRAEAEGQVAGLREAA